MTTIKEMHWAGTGSASNNTTGAATTQEKNLQQVNTSGVSSLAKIPMNRRQNIFTIGLGIEG